MAFLDEIKKIALEKGATLEEKKGIHVFRVLVAERKVFLSKKRLEYIAKFRVDDTAKEIKFTEMLKESGSGLSMGGGIDEGTPGFGFKIQTYKTGMNGRQGGLEEQSNLFGKTYSYVFDFKLIRSQFENISNNLGYRFKYQITPFGL
jgi:hypothetical protein